MRAEFEIGGETHSVAPVHRPNGLDLKIGDRTYSVAVRTLSNGEQVVTVDGRPHRVWIAGRGKEIFVHAGGCAWTVTAVDEVEAASAGGGTDHVSAPMPGTVVSVKAAMGDPVASGQEVLVIESMKLETSITAPRDGVIAELPFEAGATFDKGAMLVRFEPIADE